jgi:hypothetical protein
LFDITENLTKLTTLSYVEYEASLRAFISGILCHRIGGQTDEIGDQNEISLICNRRSSPKPNNPYVESIEYQLEITIQPTREGK